MPRATAGTRRAVCHSSHEFAARGNRERCRAGLVPRGASPAYWRLRMEFAFLVLAIAGGVVIGWALVHISER